MKKVNNKSMFEQTGVPGSADKIEETFSKGRNYSNLTEC